MRLCFDGATTLSGAMPRPQTCLIGRQTQVNIKQVNFSKFYLLKLQNHDSVHSSETNQHKVTLKIV